MIDLLRNTPDLKSSEAGLSPSESEHFIDGQERLEGSEGEVEQQGYEASSSDSERGDTASADQSVAGQQSEQQQVETFVPAPEAVLNETLDQIEDQTDKLLTEENKIDPANSSTAKELLDILNGEK